MYITPKAGLVVRNPATGEILPTTGAEIPPGPHRAYWLRRQKDGDVTIHAVPPAAPAKGKAAAGEEGK